jgi:hypothetical protein
MKNLEYVIYNFDKKQFYPDPIYTDLEKAENKIAYLKEYRIKNDMPEVNYGLMVLTKERKAQHQKEWQAFCSAID